MLEKTWYILDHSRQKLLATMQASAFGIGTRAFYIDGQMVSSELLVVNSCRPITYIVVPYV